MSRGWALLKSRRNWAHRPVNLPPSLEPDGRVRPGHFDVVAGAGAGAGDLFAVLVAVGVQVAAGAGSFVPPSAASAHWPLLCFLQATLIGATPGGNLQRLASSHLNELETIHITRLDRSLAARAPSEPLESEIPLGIIWRALIVVVYLSRFPRPRARPLTISVQPLR